MKTATIDVAGLLSALMISRKLLRSEMRLADTTFGRLPSFTSASSTTGGTR